LVASHPGTYDCVEPVLVVMMVLLFASSVIVDGIVQAIGHAARPVMRMIDDLVHRPVTYEPGFSFGLRQRPARSAVLR
jgi:hypothetical protein